MKHRNQLVNKEFLTKRILQAKLKGFGKAKWIEFCEALLDKGFDVRLYEANKTVSKYVTVERGQRAFKVRFSNHKPIKEREMTADCDFFVGITHTGVRTTSDAMNAVESFFHG